MYLVCLRLVEVSKNAPFFSLKSILVAPICLSDKELFLKLKWEYVEKQSAVLSI